MAKAETGASRETDPRIKRGAPESGRFHLKEDAQGTVEEVLRAANQAAYRFRECLEVLWPPSPRKDVAPENRPKAEQQYQEARKQVVSILPVVTKKRTSIEHQLSSATLTLNHLQQGARSLHGAEVRRSVQERIHNQESEVAQLEQAHESLLTEERYLKKLLTLSEYESKKKEDLDRINGRIR